MRSARDILTYTGIFLLPLTWEPVIDAGFPLKTYEVVFGVALCFALVSWKDYRRLLSSAYVRFLLLFIIIAGISGLSGTRLLGQIKDFPAWAVGRNNPYMSILYEWLYLVFDAGVMLLVAGLVVFKKRTKTALYALMAGSAVACLYGLYQLTAYYAGLPVSVFPTMPERQAVFAFIIPRITSFFKEPGYLAGYLVCLMPVTILYIFKKKKNSIPVLLLILQFAVLYCTFSTAGWLVFFVMSLLQCWLLRTNNMRVAIILALSICGAVLLLMAANPQIFYEVVYDKLFGRFVNPNTISRIQRKEQIINALLLFFRHPFLGVGLSNYGMMAHHALGIKSSFNMTVNNIYAEILCETGMAGFLSFMAFVCTPVIRFVRTRCSPDSVMHRSLFIMMLSLLFILNSFPSHTLAFAWVVMGLGVGFLENREQ